VHFVVHRADRDLLHSELLTPEETLFVHNNGFLQHVVRILVERTQKEAAQMAII